jgi:hypothetical protein
MALTTYPYLEPRLKKELSYMSIPLLGLHFLLKGEFCPYEHGYGNDSDTIYFIVGF